MVTYLLRAGFLSPGCTCPDLDRSSRHRRSLVWGQHGPEHPDSGFRVLSGQHNRRPCNRSTNRRKTPCHGFHDRSLYAIRPDVLTIWHGTSIIAAQNVLNSIRSSDRFSARYFSAHRPCRVQHRRSAPRFTALPTNGNQSTHDQRYATHKPRPTTQDQRNRPATIESAGDCGRNLAARHHLQAVIASAAKQSPAFRA